MIEALKKVEVLTKGCVDKILDKLANGRGDDGLARLVEALNKAEVLKEERVTKILPEFIPDGISIVENMKLVINLKRNNIDVKLLKLLVPFWDDSLSGNELFKKTDIDKIEEKNIITQVIIKYLEKG